MTARDPHPVQIEALKRSNGALGFAYFMEQGLGKTYTSYLDFKDRLAERNATRMVVFCPNSFKSGWVDDAYDSGIGDDFDFHVYESGSWANDAFLRREYKKPPVMIMNYEAARTDAAQEVVKKFTANRNVFCVADESIQIKTHNSLTTRSLLELGKEMRYTRILSGKPVTQGPHDLWAQMRFIKQLNGRNFYAFKTAFCKMGGFKMKQVVGVQNEDILAELIERHIFRATKAQWTDLPPKTYTAREYKLSPEMKRMYDQMYNDFVLWLNEDENVSVDAAITKYIKLAQIQCGWIYDEAGKFRELVPIANNPRLNLLDDVISNEIVGKTIVVYHHRPVYDMLMGKFDHLNPAWIKGQMSPDEISAQKVRFNNDPNCRTIFLQDVASKYGHTLLGHGDGSEHRCFTTLFFENSYSLDTRSQIEDRNHRHGQTADSVSYIDLIGTPLDRDAVRALQRKENVFQAIFSHIH